LASARSELVSKTRVLLMRRLNASPSDAQRLVRLVRSGLSLSIRRYLTESPTGE
jgi:hypothetical protein